MSCTDWKSKWCEVSQYSKKNPALCRILKLVFSTFGVNWNKLSAQHFCVNGTNGIQEHSYYHLTVLIGNRYQQEIMKNWHVAIRKYISRPLKLSHPNCVTWDMSSGNYSVNNPSFNHQNFMIFYEKMMDLEVADWRNSTLKMAFKRFIYI